MRAIKKKKEKEISDAMRRLLAELYILKVLLMRTKTEMKNMLLETSGKTIIVTEWQRN